MGVEIKTGVTFGSDITLESLKEDGYSGPFSGYRPARRHETWASKMKTWTAFCQGVDFLRDAAMGNKIAHRQQMLWSSAAAMWPSTWP